MQKMGSSLTSKKYFIILSMSVFSGKYYVLFDKIILTLQYIGEAPALT